MNDDSLRTLRRLIWLYFWLLIFEGALRKWVLPSYSTYLLIVRDPVVLMIYLVAASKRAFPYSGFVWCIFALALLDFSASFAGNGTLYVTLYGLRADFLHLPLVFLIPRVFRPEDVKRLGFAVLTTLPMMTFLAVLQFKGGPESRWNVGAGGELGGQLFAAEGRMRASGTFSFVTGMASYLALCTAYILSSAPKRTYPVWLNFCALPALVLTLAISGSRSAVLSVAIVCMVMLYMGLRQPATLGAVVRPMLFAAVAFVVLDVVTPLVKEGIAVQKSRFEGAGGLEQGILFRYGQDFVYAWESLFHAPALGIGLGIGTNAGARLLSGEREFLLGEGEWQRVIMESGPFLGSAFIILRVTMLIGVIGSSYGSYRRGRPLPMLLAGASGLDLLTGQFGQPTALGFAVFTSGLALAAAQTEEDEEPVEPHFEVVQRVPGRSAYARRLHGGSLGDSLP